MEHDEIINREAWGRALLKSFQSMIEARNRDELKRNRESGAFLRSRLEARYPKCACGCGARLNGRIFKSKIKNETLQFVDESHSNRMRMRLRRTIACKHDKKA